MPRLLAPHLAWFTWIALLAVPVAVSAKEAAFVSYPPLRDLPTASDRPLDKGPAYFVDPVKGSDSVEGTEQKPWKTVNHAVKQLKPGDTLYLRGGIYWERVAASPQGNAGDPITIRSYPGELAVLDGGHREFFDDPAGSWEPVPNGGESEYRSLKAYPGPIAAGNFGDSLVPLRMYGSFVDLRSRLGHEDKALVKEKGVYVGPGVKRDEATGRIHVRLSHTSLKGLGDENYRGETDPRKLKVVIASDGNTLHLKGAKHLRIQDIVLRGATTVVRLADSEDIAFDGVTIYAVRYGMIVQHVAGLTVTNSAFRGFDAPWHPRSSGTDVDCFCPLDLVTADSGSNFEFAFNEFTDHHDCIQMGDVDVFKFHHNYVDHFNDDCLDIDLHKLGTYHIYQNRISRCLTAISIHKAATDADRAKGFYFYRNVIDLRRGTYSHPPASPNEWDEEIPNSPMNRAGRLISDHGSPTWPPIFFYHNTVLLNHPTYRSQYGGGIGFAGLKQTNRRVFNNMFVHRHLVDAKSKSAVLPAKPAEVDLQIDGNLLWGLDGAADQTEYLSKFRNSKPFEESKKQYPPGWLAQDLVANPEFTALALDLRQPTDLRLRPNSPAVNRGIIIPNSWPDPLREKDQGSPDIGAMPLGAAPWRIGIRERLPLFP